MRIGICRERGRRRRASPDDSSRNMRTGCRCREPRGHVRMIRRSRPMRPVRDSRMAASDESVSSSPVTAAGLPRPELVAAIPRLRRYARVLTRNPARADDLVQDTLLRAWDKRGLWKAGSDLRAWLFTIMHNVYQNQRALARGEAANVSLDAEGEHGAAWHVAQSGNQLERVELRELANL